MTDQEIARELHRKHRDRDPERYRRLARKRKLRLRFGDRIEGEIAATAEKLALLKDIRSERA